jgi:hypothetical protein
VKIVLCGRIFMLKPSSPIYGAPFRSTVIHHRADSSPCGFITVRIHHRAGFITVRIHHRQIDTQPPPVR